MHLSLLAACLLLSMLLPSVGPMPEPGSIAREVFVAVPAVPFCKCEIMENGSTNTGSTCPGGELGPYFTIVTVGTPTNGPCTTPSSSEAPCEENVGAKCVWIVDVTLRWQATPAGNCNTVCLKGGNLGPPPYQTVASPATPTIRVTADADCKKDTENEGKAPLLLWLGACANQGQAPPDNLGEDGKYELKIKCKKCAR